MCNQQDPDELSCTGACEATDLLLHAWTVWLTFCTCTLLRHVDIELVTTVRWGGDINTKFLNWHFFLDFSSLSLKRPEWKCFIVFLLSIQVLILCQFISLCNLSLASPAFEGNSILFPSRHDLGCFFNLQQQWSQNQKMLVHVSFINVFWPLMLVSVTGRGLGPIRGIWPSWDVSPSQARPNLEISFCLTACHQTRKGNLHDMERHTNTKHTKQKWDSNPRPWRLLTSVFTIVPPPRSDTLGDVHTAVS